MGETKIEIKIDEEIKPLKELCEKIVKMATNEIEQNPSVDTHEMYEVVDMIKDLSEAKKFVAETCYKKYLLGVMEKNEDDYGETWDEDGDWDEEGRRYYRGQSRDSIGRYTSRGGNRNGRSGRGGRRSYQEPPYYHMMPEDDYMMDMETYKNHSAKELRDNDRKNGKLYYHGDSEYDSLNKKFIKSKENNEDQTISMKKLEEYFNEVQNELLEMQPYMTPSEKTYSKQKLNNWIPKF